MSAAADHTPAAPASAAGLAAPALVAAQYHATTRHLGSRIDLYRAYQHAPPAWHEWLWARLALDPFAGRVLDLGCGTGALWRGRSPLPALTLVDASAAMIDQCRRDFSAEKNLAFAQADAASYLASTPSHFDLILACHLVYHLPDPAHVVRLAGARLAPGGRLAVTTVGARHLEELRPWLQDLERALGLPDFAPLLPPACNRASELADLLQPCFAEVSIEPFTATLEITGDLAPLVAYLLSLHRYEGLAGGRDFAARFRAAVADRFRRQPRLTVTSHNWLAVARGPR